MTRLHRLPCLIAPALLAACAAHPPNKSASPIRLPRGLAYHERVQTYRVIGADRATIAQGLRNMPGNNGERFAGRYQWRLSWRFNTRSTAAQCFMSQAGVTIEAVLTLPEWSAPTGADPLLIEEWQRYLAALTAHETGHRDLALAGAERLQSALLQVSPRHCGATQADARQVAQQLLGEMKQEDVRYDETTHHGATQGAVWRKVR